MPIDPSYYEDKQQAEIDFFDKQRQDQSALFNQQRIDTDIFFKQLRASGKNTPYGEKNDLKTRHYEKQREEKDTFYNKQRKEKEEFYEQLRRTKEKKRVYNEWLKGEEDAKIADEKKAAIRAKNQAKTDARAAKSNKSSPPKQPKTPIPPSVAKSVPSGRNKQGRFTKGNSFGIPTRFKPKGGSSGGGNNPPPSGGSSSAGGNNPVDYSPYFNYIFGYLFTISQNTGASASALQTLISQNQPNSKNNASSMTGSSLSGTGAYFLFKSIQILVLNCFKRQEEQLEVNNGLLSSIAVNITKIADEQRIGRGAKSEKNYEASLLKNNKFFNNNKLLANNKLLSGNKIEMFNIGGGDLLSTLLKIGAGLLAGGLTVEALSRLFPDADIKNKIKDFVDKGFKFAGEIVVEGADSFVQGIIQGAKNVVEKHMGTKPITTDEKHELDKQLQEENEISRLNGTSAMYKYKTNDTGVYQARKTVNENKFQGSSGPMAGGSSFLSDRFKELTGKGHHKYDYLKQFSWEDVKDEFLAEDDIVGNTKFQSEEEIAYVLQKLIAHGHISPGYSWTGYNGLDFYPTSSKMTTEHFQKLIEEYQREYRPKASPTESTNKLPIPYKPKTIPVPHRGPADYNERTRQGDFSASAQQAPTINIINNSGGGSRTTSTAYASPKSISGSTRSRDSTIEMLERDALSTSIV